MLMKINEYKSSGAVLRQPLNSYILMCPLACCNTFKDLYITYIMNNHR